MSAAYFSIEQLASLEATDVNAALSWLESTPAGPERARDLLGRRALFACMVERSLPIPLSLLGARSVLLIDDEPAVLRSMSRLIRQAAPELTLVLAEGARAGLALASTLAPDVIVVDAHMPETSGVEVCSRIRAGLATERPLVLAMTAQPTPQLAAAFAGAGAIAFLEKPVDAPALFEVLSTHLVPSAGDW